MIVRTYVVDLETGRKYEAVWTTRPPAIRTDLPSLVVNGRVVDDTDFSNEDTPVLLAKAWDDGYRSGMVEAYRAAEGRIRQALRDTFPDLGGGK